MTLCKYFKVCDCACSGESDEVGEIDELCTIGKLHAKIDRIKKTLKEIRKMAIYDCIHECSNNSENCTIGSCLEKRIQRKINKVLGAE